MEEKKQRSQSQLGQEGQPFTQLPLNSAVQMMGSL
jgi:hypothetical protein